MLRDPRETWVESCCSIKPIDAQITQEDIHWLMKVLTYNDDNNDCILMKRIVTYHNKAKEKRAIFCSYCNLNLKE